MNFDIPEDYQPILNVVKDFASVKCNRLKLNFCSRANWI